MIPARVSPYIFEATNILHRLIPYTRFVCIFFLSSQQLWPAIQTSYRFMFVLLSNCMALKQSSYNHFILHPSPPLRLDWANFDSFVIEVIVRNSHIISPPQFCASAYLFLLEFRRISDQSKIRNPMPNFRIGSDFRYSNCENFRIGSDFGFSNFENFRIGSDLGF